MRRRAITLTSRAAKVTARGLGRAALRLGREAERLGHRAAGGPPSAARRHRRLSEAMAVVAHIEAIDSTLTHSPQSRAFHTVDRWARRPHIDPTLSSMLPQPWQGAEVDRLRFPVGADVVALAKFDLGEQVKLRAGYGAGRRTLAVQPVRANGSCGVTNAVESHAIVSRHAPGLMPTVLSHGELPDGLRYLVEEWAEGEPALTSPALAGHVPQLLEGLARVHEGYGVHGQTVTQIWGRRYAARWQAVRDAGLVSPESGAAVARLIDADRRVRVSWTHGDLVASNVLAGPRGPVVIDWEHAGERPLMRDAAKLHLFAADKEPLLDLLLAEWARTSGEGYSAAEELVLVHAQFLTNAPTRMVRLSGHERGGIYAQQVARQAALLHDVVVRLS